MFIADVFGHRNDPLAFREGGKIDALLSHLLRGWSDALGYTQADDSFGRLRCFLLAQYRSWFASELNNAFGIDIFSAARVSNRRTWRIAKDGIEILIYRYEDLPSREVVEEVGEFLALDLGPLPITNQTSSRRSGDLYGNLRERCKLPEEWLERIYAEPILAHFYSREEIIAFKARSLPKGQVSPHAPRRTTV
jgi:putative capsular polysaccharide synthesis protein